MLLLRAIWLIVVLMIAIPAYAQSSGATTGAMVGTVTDGQGKTIIGALVTAKLLATNLTRSVSVEMRGSYKILQLPPGDYLISAQAEGFSIVTIQITLNVGTTFLHDFILPVAAARADIEVFADNL